MSAGQTSEVKMSGKERRAEDGASGDGARLADERQREIGAGLGASVANRAGCQAGLAGNYAGMSKSAALLICW